MTERYLGLDLIRLISFAAIAVFHVSFIHYGTESLAISRESVIVELVERAARTISFSGFTIVFLTSFLTAFSSSKPTQRLRLFGLLFLGWFLLSKIVFGSLSALLAWDIYPLLFLGLALCTAVEICAPALLLTLAGLGMAMLWVPVWELGSVISFGAGWDLILGLKPCARGQVEWPILPWVGLIWLGYGAGIGLKQSISDRGLPWQKYESGVWPALLILSVPQLGSYYNIRLGPWFACDAYRQQPVVFWSHFIWVIFACRLAFIPHIQRFLQRTKGVKAVGQLAISKKFWLAYMLHFILALGVTLMLHWTRVESTSWNGAVIATIAVTFLPMIEVSCRLLLFLGNKIWSIKKP